MSKEIYLPYCEFRKKITKTIKSALGMFLERPQNSYKKLVFFFSREIKLQIYFNYCFWSPQKCPQLDYLYHILKTK